MFLRIAEKGAHIYCVVGMGNDVEKSFHSLQYLSLSLSTAIHLPSIDGNSSSTITFPTCIDKAALLPAPSHQAFSPRRYLYTAIYQF